MKQGFIGDSSRDSHRWRAATWLGAALATGAIAIGGCQDPNSGGARNRHKPAAHGEHGEHGEADPAPPPSRPPMVSVAAVLEQAKTHFGPLPASVKDMRNPLTEEKIALGRMLYFDPRLSKAGDVSCATCHDLAGYGVDIRKDGGARAKTSAGHEGQRGDRNAPTVYNAGLHLAQFWDGRAASLEEQAKGPVLNPIEMAMADEATVVATLSDIPGYVAAFGKAFPDAAQPVTYDNMAKAIGAFERRLVTPGPFDAFLGGKLTALSEPQLRGLKLFMDVECTQCHTGPAVGGTMYQKLGTVKAWEGLKDQGRAAITKAPTDKFVFKVPSLRNITETGPYLHDGSIATLDEMVQKMAAHQLAKGEFSETELADLLDFLGSLKGELPTDYIAMPTLPGSGDTPPAEAAPGDELEVPAGAGDAGDVADPAADAKPDDAAKPDDEQPT